MELKQRQDQLLAILHFLQAGGDFDEAKRRFAKQFDHVSVKEITQAERGLIRQGLNPVEIQQLCTIHAEVFKQGLESPAITPSFDRPGHPVQTLKQENLVITSLVNDALLPDLAKWEANQTEEILTKIRQELADLALIDRHYARKETSIFPLMMKHGITAPPQVMWGVDDDIRHLIANAQAASLTADAALPSLVKQATDEVIAMIFKEEAIMLPLLADVVSPREWEQVKREEAQIGYTLINKPVTWHASASEQAAWDKQDHADQVDKWNNEVQELANSIGAKEQARLAEHEAVQTELNSPANPQPVASFANLSQLAINFAQGSLTLEQLSLILDLLPFDLTFVDQDNIIRFFGGGAHFYPHSQHDLGLNLFSVHMPKSFAKVKTIIDDLKAGRRDAYEFWFELRGRFVYIQYIAVRDQTQRYLGVLEVLQDATYVRSLQGNKKEL